MANNDALGATVISRGWIRVKRGKLVGGAGEGDRSVRTGSRTSFAELVKRLAIRILKFDRFDVGFWQRWT